jgi:hypothetical protein
VSVPIGPAGWLLLAGWMALAMAAGASFGAEPWRRGLSSVCVALLLVLPFAAPAEEHLARGLVGLGAMMALMRRVEAARGPRPPLPWALLFLLPVDVPTLRAAPARLDREDLVRALVHAIVLALGVALVRLSLAAPASSAPLGSLLRWLGGAMFFYGFLDTAASLARAALAAFGIDVAPMQRDPILSRSVAEHWGARWNLVVSTWLRRFVLLPVTRRTRSVIAGSCASFAWSAALHAFFVLAALGPGWALSMGGYFVLQGLAFLLEQRLGLSRWPSWLARAWTVLVVLGASPLFVEPGLRLLSLV